MVSHVGSWAFSPNEVGVARVGVERMEEGGCPTVYSLKWLSQ